MGGEHKSSLGLFPALLVPCGSSASRFWLASLQLQKLLFLPAIKAPTSRDLVPDFGLFPVNHLPASCSSPTSPLPPVLPQTLPSSQQPTHTYISTRKPSSFQHTSAKSVLRVHQLIRSEGREIFPRRSFLSQSSPNADSDSNQASSSTKTTKNFSFFRAELLEPWEGSRANLTCELLRYSVSSSPRPTLLIPSRLASQECLAPSPVFRFRGAGPRSVIGREK